jgi:hypothetical protein
VRARLRQRRRLGFQGKNRIHLDLAPVDRRRDNEFCIERGDTERIGQRARPMETAELRPG